MVKVRDKRKDETVNTLFKIRLLYDEVRMVAVPERVADVEELR